MAKEIKHKGGKKTLVKLVAFLIFMGIFVQITASMETPMLSIYLLKLSGDLRHVGAIYSIFTFSMAITAMLAAQYAHKSLYGLLFTSYLGMVIYCLVMFMQPNLVVIYIIQCFGGIMSGVGWVGFLHLFVKSVRIDEYTKYYSINKFVASAFGSAAAASSGFIATYMSIPHIFLFMAGISTIALCLAVLVYWLDMGHFFDVEQQKK